MYTTAFIYLYTTHPSVSQMNQLIDMSNNWFDMSMDAMNVYSLVTHCNPNWGYKIGIVFRHKTRHSKDDQCALPVELW